MSCLSAIYCTSKYMACLCLKWLSGAGWFNIERERAVVAPPLFVYICWLLERLSEGSNSKCAVMQFLPPPMDQRWKSSHEMTPFTCNSSFLTWSMSTSLGPNSMTLWKQSMKTGTVVNNTIIEKTYVHIGSAILYWGRQYMMDEAMITPTDWMRSPTAWTTADRILRF